MIKAENLYFSYTGSPPYLLAGIDFVIQDGEYLSIVGDNGSGKSTLLRLILKFIRPLSGVITCDATRIGYVPQRKDFANTDFPITVYEALNSYRSILKLKDSAVISNTLELVGMADYANALMGTLSGGQSQRVFIARALLGQPDLLLLDEPSTGMDQHSQQDVYHLLRTLNEQHGVTIISVEHNLNAAISNSTLIYHLKDGQGHLCTPQQYIDEYLTDRMSAHAHA
ncbi:MAG: metal ABC transporter ATP-binding protein [Coriobacteriia bacterium]|nr:metal ABC transporter ATP-binding protein [Coriobacteriia bacterium]